VVVVVFVVVAVVVVVVVVVVWRRFCYQKGVCFQEDVVVAATATTFTVVY